MMLILSVCPEEGASLLLDDDVADQAMFAYRLCSSAHHRWGSHRVEACCKAMTSPWVDWINRGAIRYRWVRHYWDALCNEHKKRTGEPHLSYWALEDLSHQPLMNPHIGALAPFLVTVPMVGDSAVQSYRTYYATRTGTSFSNLSDDRVTYERAQREFQSGESHPIQIDFGIHVDDYNDESDPYLRPIVGTSSRAGDSGGRPFGVGGSLREL